MAQLFKTEAEILREKKHSLIIDMFEQLRKEYPTEKVGRLIQTIAHDPRIQFSSVAVRAILVRNKKLPVYLQKSHKKNS